MLSFITPSIEQIEISKKFLKISKNIYVRCQSYEIAAYIVDTERSILVLDKPQIMERINSLYIRLDSISAFFYKKVSFDDFKEFNLVYGNWIEIFYPEIFRDERIRLIIGDE